MSDMGAKRLGALGEFRRAAIGLVIAAAAAAILPAGGAAAYSYHVIHNFCSRFACGDGQDPSASLIIDSSGRLFGTTVTGGFYGGGAAFQLAFDPAHQSWRLTVLHAFCAHANCTDGRFPLGPLIMDSEGNLYGTASFGGLGGNTGTVFELVQQSGGASPRFRLLYSFCPQPGCADGDGPASGLTYAGAASGALYDGHSPLYGTTSVGGANNQGVAYQLSRSGKQWSEQAIYSFCAKPSCNDGTSPASGLILDQSGNLYGALANGGPRGAGIAYELSQNGGTWSEANLHTFCIRSDCGDGSNPDGELVMDAAGDLFGSTIFGGAVHNNCCGVIYKLLPGGAPRQYTIPHHFCSLSNCRDGARPARALLMEPSGDLIGVTSMGGGNNIDPQHLGGGTVFRLSGTSLTTLYAFCAQPNCADGEYPRGGLAEDAAGNLFGTTSVGGEFGGGVVFELTP